MSPTSAPPDTAPRVDPPLGYSDLAWWPEIADGAEGEDMAIALVTKPDGSTTATLETEKEAERQGHQAILKGIRVGSPQDPTAKPMGEIFFKAQGDESPQAATVDGLPCDAVFSTRSAMRKFVLLYYRSQGILDDDKWKLLNAAIADPTVAAIGHVYPSHSGPLGTDPGVRILKTAQVKTKLVGKPWLTLDEYAGQSKR